MEKIAVTVATPDLDAEVERRFGRAAYLLIVDPETMRWDALENPGARVGGGAGIQAAQLMGRHEVGTVVTGGVGPNAQEALRSAGIAVSLPQPGTTAREAVVQLKEASGGREGKAAGITTSPSVPGEVGRGRWGGEGKGRGGGRGHRGEGGGRGGGGGRGAGGGRSRRSQ